MSDIHIDPDHLTRSGGKLGSFGEQLASGGQKLEQAGENLVNHASGDRSGIGAVVAKAFGEGVKITGKVFKEGGGWAARAGQRLKATADIHTENDANFAKKFGSLHKGHEDPGHVPGGGRRSPSRLSGGAAGTRGRDGTTRRDSAVPTSDKLPRCETEPVDPVTGEVVQHLTDLVLPGSLPLVLRRTHLSAYRAGRLFGRTWASTLDQRLEIDSDGVCFVAEDGMLLLYPHGEELPEEGPRWPLHGSQEDGYTITDARADRMLHFAVASPTSPGVMPLVAITDRNGNRIDFVRDEGGLPTEVWHSAGHRIAVDTELDRVRGLRLTSGGDIQLMRYGYDAAGHLAEVVNSSGQPLLFSYDAEGRLDRWQDRNGVEYRYFYDERGRCVRTWSPDGWMNGAFSYAPNVTTYTDSLGNSSETHVNAHRQVVRKVDALGNAETFEWDRYDNLLTHTDALGRTTRNTYDERGNLVGIERPDGTTVTAEHNDFHQLLTLVAPDGAVTRHEYDDRGNLTAVTDPVGATTRYGYDSRGNLASIVDALGATRTVECDAAGLPVVITDPDGATVRCQRDAFGRPAVITDQVGGVARFGWTVEGRLTWKQSASGATERYTYDGEGNLLQHIDAAGGVTRMEYTGFDLPAARIAPDGARMIFGYDSELRLTTVTNPQGLLWRYTYDAVGNLLSEVDFNGRELGYAYDAAGQLVQMTNGVGQRVEYRHDAMGRVVEERTDSGAVATFGYDPAGRLLSAVNDDADVRFERDAAGAVIAESCNGNVIASTYDLLGRRTSRRTPAGAVSEWEFDANDRAVAIRTAGQLIRFGYDAAGRETERHLGVGALVQTWDGDSRLRSQALTVQAGRGSQLAQRRHYTYRADGYPTEVVDQLAGPRRYELDPVGRVTAVHGATEERYAYDPAGNLVQDPSGARQHSGTLLQRTGNLSFGHDGQGRVVWRQRRRLSLRPETWRYEWDAYDRMTAVVTPDGTRWRYRYDALGRRTAKQRLDSAGEVVEQVDFVWDGIVLAEQSTGGRVTSWDYEPDSFRPLAQTERDDTDQRFYAIVTDLVGTTTELVAADGTVAWQLRSTLWGTLAEPAATPLRFPGQYFDVESGLHYNYHRYYDPTTGGYQSADPMGLDAGPNPHRYVLNPMVWFDPLGLAPYAHGKKKRWKVGDDPFQQDAQGKDPRWSTVRKRFWKNEANEPYPEQQYGKANVARMRRGLAPQRVNPATGDTESMELSHEPIPDREGGKVVTPRWPDEHALLDPHRHLKKRRP